MKQKSSTFTLGDRGEVLTSQLEAPAVVPHTASKDDRKVSGILHQGIIDCKGTETWQFFPVCL